MWPIGHIPPPQKIFIGHRINTHKIQTASQTLEILGNPIIVPWLGILQIVAMRPSLIQHLILHSDIMSKEKIL